MAITQMDLMREEFAYQVCTNRPLCPKVLLDTEILKREENHELSIPGPAAHSVYLAGNVITRHLPSLSFRYTQGLGF